MNAPPPPADAAAPVALPPAPAVTPRVKQHDVQKLDANPVDPAFEEKARVLLADNAPVDTLSDDALRQRLDAIRDILASNKLSPETEKALRDRLAADRTVLRSRLAAKDQPPAQPMSPPAPGAGPQDAGPAALPPARPGADPTQAAMPRASRDAWLRDRRPGRDLPENELRVRIDAYLDAARDPGYDDTARRRWRDLAMGDRRFLRDRMLHDRDRRRSDLEAQFGRGDFNIRLGVNVTPDREMRDVFAAEVDDETMQDVLVAPPRIMPNRRYSVDEIEARPAIRNMLPRIEIDTVHFGFNEAFVREEEVGKLDRIGTIMERIIRAHPNEVFLIEGHTDAVGSDAYNLALSRARAEAVKQALTTYYIIPARNLRAAGMGERYLRIPTAEAEPENRRVSVSRATDIIGGAD